MEKFLLTLIMYFYLGSLNCFSQGTRDVYLIVQVNDEILTSLTALKVSIQNGDKTYVIDADYAPGRLIIKEDDAEVLLHSSKVTLAFDYYSYPKKESNLDNLSVKLSPELFKQRYLILSFYAFSDKKYKRWYKVKPDQEFAVDLIFPNSGILIRRK